MVRAVLEALRDTDHAEHFHELKSECQLCRYLDHTLSEDQSAQPPREREETR